MTAWTNSTSEGVGVISNPKNYVADFGPLNRAFGAIFLKTLQHDFPKMSGGGGQRPFGTFPKIYPFWYRHPSLRSKTKYEKVQLHKEFSGPAII